MGVQRFLGNLVTVPVAALLGNWVGDQLRTIATGEPSHPYQLAHTNEQGETVVAVNLVLSNYLPALLASLISKPRWLWAFLGGILASALLGDRYEQPLMDILGQLGQGFRPASE